jgi:hypothetical protein
MYGNWPTSSTLQMQTSVNVQVMRHLGQHQTGAATAGAAGGVSGGGAAAAPMLQGTQGTYVTV